MSLLGHRAGHREELPLRHGGPSEHFSVADLIVLGHPGPVGTEQRDRRASDRATCRREHFLRERPCPGTILTSEGSLAFGAGPKLVNVCLLMWVRPQALGELDTAREELPAEGRPDEPPGF